MKNIYLVCFLFFFILTNKVAATHILSGSMTYKCLGNNEYEITMILYRDCQNVVGTLDNPAYLAVYRESDQSLVTNQPIELQILNTVDPLECEPNGTVEFCAEKGIYVDTLMLESGFGSYTISYQRCCWSNAVINILEAASRGITVTTEISVLAQELCNSQPIIDMPLSFSACPNQEIVIPIEPFDEEGDSLVYELCMPFEGGGNGSVGTCESAMPIPPCPPPYTVLPFASGFDIDNPFPTIDGIHIDPSNQTISFTPTTQGVYIYGLCISEYRDGQILSFSRNNIETTSGVGLTTDQAIIENENWVMYNSLSQMNITFAASRSCKNGEIHIFDITGKSVWNDVIDGRRKIVIDTHSLNSGIYFANLFADGVSQTFKMMVVP